MSDKKKQQSKLLVKVRGLLLGLCLIAGVGVGLAYAEENARSCWFFVTMIGPETAG